MPQEKAQKISHATRNGSATQAIPATRAISGRSTRTITPPTPTRDEVRTLAGALGRLADEGRLRILFLLEEAPRGVAGLSEALGQDLHSMSHHLRILRISGLIHSTRNGRNVSYSLTPRGEIGLQAARSLHE